MQTILELEKLVEKEKELEVQKRERKDLLKKVQPLPPFSGY